MLPHVQNMFDKFLPLAHPTTKVIIVDGNMDDCELYQYQNYELCDEDERRAEGPECHLCGEAIVDINNPLTYEDTTYSIVYKDDLLADDWDYCALQCIYCLNFFHRNRCNVTMTNESYTHILLSKNWACPSCVPIFVSRYAHINKDINKDIDYDKLLHKLAKLLNPLLSQSIDTCSYTKLFNYLTRMIIRLTDKFGIG